MIHIYAAFSTLLSLKRVCPKCGRGQVVKPSKKTETILCKFCSAKIPPPAKE